MAYSTTDQVKEILGITETTYDTEITNCITDADAWIDNKVKRYVASLPFPSPPATITIASKYRAAAFFRERRDPVGAKAFLDTAAAVLGEYIENYYVGKAQ